MPPRKAKPARKGAKDKGGRKPAPPDAHQRSRVTLYLTDEEKAFVQRAADFQHDKLASWGRRLVLKAAEECLGIRPPDTAGK